MNSGAYAGTSCVEIGMGGIALLGVVSLLLSVQTQEPKVSVSLVPETPTIAPGKSFDVVVRIDIERPWHIYWQNPGDTGVPTNVDWQLPDGWKVAPLQFPVPKRFESGGYVSYGHEGEVLLISRLTPPSNAKGRVTLKASIDWLACIEACVIGQADVQTQVTIGGDSGVAGVKSPVLERARAALPTSSEGLQVTTVPTVDGYRLRAEGLSRVVSAYFFPYNGEAIASNWQHPIVSSNAVEVLLKRSPYAKEPPAQLSGVLLVTDAEGKSRAYQIESKLLKSTNGGT